MEMTFIPQFYLEDVLNFLLTLNERKHTFCAALIFLEPLLTNDNLRNSMDFRWDNARKMSISHVSTLQFSAHQSHS